MFKLSKFQESIVASESLFPGTPVFNIGGYIKLSVRLRHSIFRETMHRLSHEMPALRFRLSSQLSGYQYRQFVSEDFCFVSSRIIDTASDEEAVELMRHQMEVPFKLEGTSLCEMHLFDSAAGHSFVFLKMHHVIGDGLSIKFIGERFSQLYTALAEDRDPDCVEWPLVMPSYVEAETNYLASADAAQAIEYFRNKLTDTPDTRGFDTMFESNQSASLAYKRHTYRIPQNLLEQAEAYSKNNSSPGVFSILVSAIYILNHICGNDDFVAGLSTLTRTGSLFQNSIGPFINVIPFLSKIEGNMTFGDIVKRVASDIRECYQFKKLPLFTLTDALNRKTRIYNIGISYQKFDYKLDFENCDSELCFMPNSCQHEDLVFHVMHDLGGDGLRLMIDARCSLLDDRKVDFLGQRLVSLLNECLANPAVAIQDLEPTAIEERDYILHVLNNTVCDFPDHRTVMDVIDDHVLSTPKATAVIGPDGTLSYSELALRSKKLARYLAQHAPENTVGVFMDRSAALVIALHGVMRSGKAYVPISNEFPKSRVHYIRDNAGFGTVLTDQTGAELIRGYLPDTLVVVVDFALISIHDCINVNLPTLDPSDWAYVIYTSGSTGQPKGVVNIHRSLHNRIHWQQREIPIGRSDVVLQKTPYSFDVSVWEFFWPFMAGSALCMLDPGAHKEPKKILSTIHEHGVTTLHFVPSMLRLFLEVFDTALARSLRNVIVSGEELPIDVQNEFLSRSNALLYNLYGPTEAAIDVTFWRCHEDTTRVSVPIGYPIDNTHILILNKYGRIMPVGTIGEIHIGGVNVSMGYIGNPALTDEKFIPNHFGSGRLYKTGDLGKWHQRGYVDYHGRIDSQLKLNGLRIELGEIDTRLKEIGWIQDAKTIARTNGNRKALVAFCVLTDSPETVVEDVIAETMKLLREELPSYMVPSAIVPIDSIPLSHNGKADVKKLASLSIKLPDTKYVAPISEEEKALAQLMSNVLGVERVGVTDNFFDLGGTSLLAISFVNKYDRVTLQQFYANSTIRGILEQGGIEDCRLVRLGKPTASSDCIVFVPYGGGTVFVYNDLENAMRRVGSTANLFAVEVNRACNGIEELATEVVCEMEREGLLHAEKRLFLFGHCVGSALATAIGLELQRRAIKIEVLFVGGYIAGLPRWLSFVLERAQSFIYRKDARVRNFMRKIGFHNPEALDLLDSEQLFGDFRIDGYRARDFFRKVRNKKLHAHLHLLLGEKDPLTKPFERFLHGWKTYISGSVTVSRIPEAKHYFIHKEAEHVAHIVNGVLARSIERNSVITTCNFAPVETESHAAMANVALETH
jgi:amino acid adenylation domain-containing protein